MLFNSAVFVAFFAAVYAAYVGLRRQQHLQNVLLLAASYAFYAYWDWRFLGLIALSTLVDYTVGLGLSRTHDLSRRRLLLAISLVTNLGILGFFKYYNFFVGSLAEVLGTVGLEPGPFTLEIVLPVGISFYTFQTLSYTIDVYRRRIEPTPNLLNFAVFVAFFPQLVAGPIERAARFLPQVARSRRISPAQFSAGFFLLVWGYFKKVVLADNAGLIANQVFDNYQSYSGADLVVGVLAFAIQIYADFSGYSDIARGLAKLMGFELMINFRLPYFATSPRDLWRRWHVSLSTWLRDYLYVPLGGSRRGLPRTLLNLFATMLLGGLWHGASWNFILWGAYHGVLLAGNHAWSASVSSLRKRSPVVTVLQALSMFVATSGGWVLFRAKTVEQIVHFFTKMGVSASVETPTMAFETFLLSAPLIVMGLWQLWKRDLLIAAHLPPFARAAMYVVLVLCTLLFRVGGEVEFLYFQF